MSTNTQSVSFEGGVTYWTLTSKLTQRDALLAELKLSGLEKFCPRTPTAEWCAKKALKKLSNRDDLVRPLEAKDGFSLVNEWRGQDENSYRHALSVKLEADGKAVFNPESLKPVGWDETFASLRGSVPPGKMGQSLTALVYHLGGIALRQSGGVYWLPSTSMSGWRSMARALSRASGGNSVIYVIKHKMDEASMRAVRDAVVEDVGGEVERIHKEVMNGELGKKALELRTARAKVLCMQVENYEKYVSCSLTSLRDSLNKLQTALVSSKFWTMAHEMAPA